MELTPAKKRTLKILGLVAFVVLTGAYPWIDRHQQLVCMRSGVQASLHFLLLALASQFGGLFAWVAAPMVFGGFRSRFRSSRTAWIFPAGWLLVFSIMYVGDLDSFGPGSSLLRRHGWPTSEWFYGVLTVVAIAVLICVLPKLAVSRQLNEYEQRGY